MGQPVVSFTVDDKGAVYMITGSYLYPCWLRGVKPGDLVPGSLLMDGIYVCPICAERFRLNNPEALGRHVRLCGCLEFRKVEPENIPGGLSVVPEAGRLSVKGEPGRISMKEEDDGQASD